MLQPMHEHLPRSRPGALRSRLVVGPLTLTLALALLSAGCGGKSGGDAAVLRIGTLGTTASLNMFIGGEYASYKKFYPTLVEWNVDTLKPEPNFATRWTGSGDRRTWTFHTRPNAKWSDGQALTAKDVAFTFNMIVRHGSGPTASWFSYVKDLAHADTPNPNTLVLHYKTPSSGVVSNLATDVPILPQHVWAPVAAGDGKRLMTFANEPRKGRPVVSGGPFMATQHKKDEFELFERNPQAYVTPKAAGVGVKFFGNPDALVTALKSGQIDAGYDVPPTAVKTLQSAGLVVKSTPTIIYDDLAINPNPKKPKHRELLDAKVRQAFDAAIDRQAIVKVIYLGHAQPGASIITPAIGEWHDASIKAAAFDPGKANRLLDAAGYKRGAGGVRMAQGHPMAYEVLITAESAREFEMLQTQFQDIGVKLTSRSLDKEAFSAALSAPDNKYLSYDLALTSGGGGGYDPDFALKGLTCSARMFGSGGGYCNPAYDKLYARQAAVGGPARVHLVHEMQGIVAADRPVLVLAYQDHIDAWSKQWTGFRQAIDGIFSHTTAGLLTGVERAG